MNSVQKSNEAHAILLIHCPDQKGIVLAVTDFLYSNGANILSLDQYIDDQTGTFFMRVKWELQDFVIPKDKINEYFKTLLADKYGIEHELHFTDVVPRMALFVSKANHCLYDILSRWRSGEWNVEIPLVISNHESLRSDCEGFGVPFYHLEITKENKLEQEQKQLQLLEEHKVDFIVLGRYMQILTDKIISKFKNKVINIHHSFLPAFPGAKPYHSAYERGVKIIGATSHYVTEELDAGPIIEQDVFRVSHTYSIKDLVRKGRDLEKVVLSRAVYHHLNRNTMVFRNRTIVF